MVATRYSKYFTNECLKEDSRHPGSFLSTTRHLASFGGGHLSIDCIYMSYPHLVLTQPHQHEFPQYLSFFSSNPVDAREFDAEVELTLGEEAEKHVITRPTSVYIPAGLLHGPLNFKRIGRPVLFLDIAVTGQYSRVGNTPD
jgi:hypothetical protein